ncbi:MAG TPA: DNA polymerase III subunit beta [Anaerolineales bacterium]|nr:DNA polymerase III subunit beta [Anaerolineales bacterium]
MKVSCLQENLAKALGIVGKAVGARTTLPILANILVSTENNQLRLTATDLNLAISCWIGAKVEQEGAVAMPARTFIDLVNALPQGTVSLELNVRTQAVNIRCGSYNNDLKSLDAQEFPIVPTTEGQDGIEMPVELLRSLISHTVFAAATNDARPILTGVEARIRDGQITFSAADGYRLATQTGHLGAPINHVPAIIPARALHEVARVSHDPNTTAMMVLSANRSQAMFRIGNVELVSQLIEGNFPEVGQLIPKSHQTRTIVSTSELANACKAARIFARESAGTTRLKIVPGNGATPGQVMVSAVSQETGSNETTVDANVEGVPVEIAFNVQFLLDMLSAIETPNMVIETNAASTPGLFKPAGKDDFLCVVMPMNLNR